MIGQYLVKNQLSAFLFPAMEKIKSSFTAVAKILCCNPNNFIFLSLILRRQKPASLGQLHFLWLPYLIPVIGQRRGNMENSKEFPTFPHHKQQ